MPPDDNNVDAKPLTPERARVAGGLDRSRSHRRCRRQDGSGRNGKPFPARSADLRRGGLARRTIRGLHARQSDFVYGLASGQLAAQLVDPELTKTGLYAEPGVAHFDLVQALAFSPDGDRLASGAYREVKLWRRVRNASSARWTLAARRNRLAGRQCRRKMGRDRRCSGGDHALGSGHRASNQNVHRPHRTGDGPATSAAPKRSFRHRSTSRSGCGNWPTAHRSPRSPRRRPSRRWRCWATASGLSRARPMRWCASGEPGDNPAEAGRVDQSAHAHRAQRADNGPGGFAEVKRTSIFSGSADGSIRQWTSGCRRISTRDSRRARSRPADRSPAWRSGPTASSWPRSAGRIWSNCGRPKMASLGPGPAIKPLPEIKGDMRAAARAAAAQADGRSADGASWPMPRKRSPTPRPRLLAAEEAKKTAATADETAVKAAAAKVEAAEGSDRGQGSGRQTAGHAHATGQNGARRRGAIPAGAGKGSAKCANCKLLAEAAKKLADDTEQRRKAAEAAVPGRDGRADQGATGSRPRPKQPAWRPRVWPLPPKQPWSKRARHCRP